MVTLAIYFWRQSLGVLGVPAGPCIFAIDNLLCSMTSVDPYVVSFIFFLKGATASEGKRREWRREEPMLARINVVEQ